jgi:insulysin
VHKTKTTLCSSAFTASLGASGEDAGASQRPSAIRESTGHPPQGDRGENSEGKADDQDETARSEQHSGSEHSDNEHDSEEDEADDSGSETGSEGGEEGGQPEAGQAEGTSPRHTSVFTSEVIRELYTGPAEWLHLALPPAAQPAASREPHFGTAYWETSIPASLYELWESATPPAGCTLHVPLANPYIATDLALLASDGSVTADKLPERVVISTPSAGAASAPSEVVLWHLLDTSFSCPKVEMAARLTSVTACRDPRSAVCVDLLGKLLHERLNEETYMAAMAELFCSVKLSDVGVRVELSGFHDKASLLMTNAVQSLVTIAKKDSSLEHGKDDVVFARIREALLRQYTNACHKARSTAEAGRLCALKPTKHHPHRKAEVLQAKNAAGEWMIDLPALLRFAEEYVRSAHLEFYVQGNLSRQAAVGMVQNILSSSCDDTAQPVVFSPSRHPGQHVVVLPVNTAVVLWQAPGSPQENNACCEAYFQLGGWELRALTLLDVLEQLLTERFFDELRTKQQVGLLPHSFILRKLSRDSCNVLLPCCSSGTASPAV